MIRVQTAPCQGCNRSYCSFHLSPQPQSGLQSSRPPPAPSSILLLGQESVYARATEVTISEMTRRDKNLTSGDVAVASIRNRIPSSASNAKSPLNYDKEDSKEHPLAS